MGISYKKQHKQGSALTLLVSSVLSAAPAALADASCALTWSSIDDVKACCRSCSCSIVHR